MTLHRASIILAAAQNNVPAVYTGSVFARDGGLLSYGLDNVDLFRRAASYVDRILRGEKPGDRNSAVQQAVSRKAVPRPQCRPGDEENFYRRCDGYLIPPKEL